MPSETHGSVRCCGTKAGSWQGTARAQPGLSSEKQSSVAKGPVKGADPSTDTHAKGRKQESWLAVPVIQVGL